MRHAYRLVVCLIVCILFASDLKTVKANEPSEADPLFPIRYFSDRPNLNAALARISPLPLMEFSPVYTDEIELSLYEAVVRRLGRPYHSGGTDDRGYDCSGFIWRVFQDAGINFNRRPTSLLWQSMPRATDEETRQFGTLIFFKGPNHVGIMRDAYSFYHASASQGIVRSYLDSYWKSRVIGYRRVFAPIRRSMSAGKT